MKTVSLNEKNLKSLKIPVPAYDRGAVSCGIAHFGVGGFHRAHQALYTEGLLAEGETEWGIHGIGIMPADAAMRDALKAQDCLYVLEERGDKNCASVVGSLIDYTVEDGSGNVLQKITREDIRIISFTVTEGGYSDRADNGELDLDDAKIIHDIQNPQNPRTALGYIAAVSDFCRKNRRTPPTFMTCDNLPHNGSKLRGLVLQLTGETDRDLKNYIEENVLFPNTMVDRITPATTNLHREEIASRYGITDRCPVICEDFTQWIIEDRFSRGRPAWDRSGARFVKDVLPYERMKLYLLNGGHQALGFISYLLGYRKVDLAMRDPAVCAFTKKFMNEGTPAVGEVAGVDLEEYKDTLIKRFSNDAVSDQITRLTAETSSRFPYFVFPPLKILLERKLPCDSYAFLVAHWFRYLLGKDENGDVIDIVDPRRDELCGAAAKCRENAAPLLNLPSLFPDEISKNKTFADKVSDYFRLIGEKGIRRAAEEFLFRGHG